MTENKSYFVVVKMTHGKMKPEDGNCRLIALFYRQAAKRLHTEVKISQDVPQSEFVTVTGTSLALCWAISFRKKPTLERCTWMIHLMRLEPIAKDILISIIP